MKTFRTELKVSESEALVNRLRNYLPGGDTRTGTFFEPYPLGLERGKGYRVWDVDGNEFIDLNNNNTSLVHGHSHPAIVSAIREQAARGTAFPAPTSLQADVAERLSTRIPSLESLRFTNSGTEAVMLAIRAARAYTGRERIVMVGGSYHGSWDQAAVASGRGSIRGIPEALNELVHMVGLGDRQGLGAVMGSDGNEIAAILLDPFRAEVSSSDFCDEARRLADRFGSILVLDEVISARLEFGGFQSVIDVKPDMTCLGKFIGGGLPVGAFGGRREIMSVFDPTGSDPVDHAGTYNGNPLTMAAGRVSLDLLSQEEVKRINMLGDELKARIQRSLEDHGVGGRVEGYGSIITVLFDDPIHLSRFHRSALEQGVYLSNRGFMNVSTAMNEKTIGTVGAALDLAISGLGSQ